MKIAVNTRLLLKGKLEGIGWFTFETLKRITRSHPEHEFLFLFDRPWDGEFIFSDNVHPLVIQPPARHPVLWYLWFEYSIPRIIKKHGVKLLMSPDGYTSLRADCLKHTVIHDISFEHFPGHIPKWPEKYLKHYMPRFARNSDRLATVSDFSRKDISSKYQVDPSKIDVVYNGSNESYAPISESEISETRIKYSDGKPYFIYIGSQHPRKNLVNLLLAFEAFKKETGSDIKLLLVGKKMFLTGDMEQTINSMEYRGEVIFTGMLPVEEVKTLLAASLGLLYVSLFEGFGIPIVEAFYSGIPVLTSSTSSMPEVGGDAAIYADPYDVNSIREGINKLAFDNKLREELLEKGRNRRSVFSWEKTAVKYWNSVEKLL